MEFRINDIPFVNFNFQFEKELHNKLGKPNQKCNCNWECGKVYDYEILDDFKDIFKDTDKSEGKADNLTFKDKIFKGKLPLDLSKFGSDLEYTENASVNVKVEFEIDNKKLFDYLYNGKKN